MNNPDDVRKFLESLLTGEYKKRNILSPEEMEKKKLEMFQNIENGFSKKDTNKTFPKGELVNRPVEVKWMKDEELVKFQSMNGWIGIVKSSYNEVTFDDITYRILFRKYSNDQIVILLSQKPPVTVDLKNKDAVDLKKMLDKAVVEGDHDTAQSILDILKTKKSN
jgi:hypothetical protein